MTDMGEAEIVGAKERRPEEHWTLQRQEVAQVQSRGCIKRYQRPHS